MRLIRRAGLAFVVVGAFAAVISASAGAAVPEFGRCVPAEGKTGEYKGAHCTATAGGKGHYNFVPGPGAKPKFEGTAVEEPVLESAGLTISCASATFNGEYTGAKTATVTVDLIGCLNAATFKKCQSNPAKEGEIETLPLEGELGFISQPPMPVRVGLDLKRSPSIGTLSCGELGEVPSPVGTIEGSVIGQIVPIDSMREELLLKYKTVGGKQAIEQFEGGAKDTLSLKLVSGLTTSTVEAALKDKLVEVLNEEPIEIKAK